MMEKSVLALSLLSYTPPNRRCDGARTRNLSLIEDNQFHSTLDALFNCPDISVFSTPGRTRTCDQQIRRLLLYPLSYGGLSSCAIDSIAQDGTYQLLFPRNFLLLCHYFTVQLLQQCHRGEPDLYH